ncbi:MAG: hypothetical protein LBE59_09995, partial [Nevskiaceae bacterium]|nr:hypothetical protein [Nevskiaceae bacterium]
RSIIAEGNAKALAAFRSDTTLTDSDAMAFMMEINRLEALRDAATHGGRTVLVTGDGGKAGVEARALLAALPTGEAGTAKASSSAPEGGDTKGDGDAGA